MTADFSSVHHIEVDAAPQQCFDCLRRADMGKPLLGRLLLAARGIGGLRTLDNAISAGFTVIVEDRPRRLELGLVGQPWRPTGGLRRLPAEDLLAFAEPGFVRILWRFDVTPRSRGSRVTTATDIYATDATARKRFAAYWRVVRPFSGALRRSILHQVRDCAEAA